jgi:hypothetical protein
MTMLKLPIDLQSFEIIRREGFLYVDKTQYIQRMLDHGRYFFMARPRRFGKTLMVSTLSHLFAGNRELFKSLWIDKHGNWSWEAKCGQSAEVGLKQIQDNGYADPYKGMSRRILLLGIGFDPKKRMVSDWKLKLCENIAK